MTRTVRGRPCSTAGAGLAGPDQPDQLDDGEVAQPEAPGHDQDLEVALGIWMKSRPTTRPSTPSSTVPPVVARRRSIHPENLERTTARCEPCGGSTQRACRRRGHDPVAHDPEGGGVQVRGGPGEAPCTACDSRRAVDAPTCVDPDALEQRDDHDPVEDQHPAEAGHRAPPVEAQCDGGRREDDTTDDPDDRRQLDGVTELPDAELIGAVRDVGQALSEPRATLVGAREDGARGWPTPCERSREVEAPGSAQAVDERLVGLADGVRKIDRKVSVSTTASTARIAAGRKATACSLPARASCSVRRSASSRRTDVESRSRTARWLNVALS